MNCDGVRGLLSAYVDGELSAGELLRVEQHLRRCHWCADEVDALRQTIALVASLEEVEVPAAFHAQLHQRLVALGPPMTAVRTAPAHRARRQDFRRWAVPAAAAAALVISVAGYSRLTPPPAVNPAPVARVSPTSANPSGSTPAPANVAVSTGGQTTSSTPSNTTQVQDPSGQSANTTGTKQSNPGTGAVNAQAAGPTGANPPQQLGETSTKTGLHTATPSFLTDLSEPTSLPTQKRLGATFEVSVADPSARAASLKAHFTPNALSASKVMNGVTTLQFSVPAASFAAELAYLEGATGVVATNTSQELSAQIKDAYESLTSLDKQRADLDKLLAGATDAKTLEIGRQSLAQLSTEAEQAREAYQKLVDQVANGTITVTLKPAQAQ